MNIFKIGLLQAKNTVDYTDLVIYGDNTPIELSIVYMTKQDIQVMFLQGKNTVSLKKYYSVKNPEVVFLLAHDNWYSVDNTGRQLNITQMVKDPINSLRQILNV